MTIGGDFLGEGALPDLLDLGHELGRHEDGQHVLPADHIRGIPIPVRCARAVVGLALAAPATSEEEVLAVDFLDGHPADGTQQHCGADEHADARCRHGLGAQLQHAGLCGGYGAFPARGAVDLAQGRGYRAGHRRHGCPHGCACGRRCHGHLHRPPQCCLLGPREHLRQAQALGCQPDFPDDVADGLRLALAARLHDRRTAGEVVWNTESILCLIYNGVLASALAFFLWSWILQHIEVSKASVAVLAVPVVGVVGGILCLGEPMTLHIFFGMLMIMAGIYIVVTHKRQPA
jgi:multidrug transporter EmrE-like cation transporter